ncbi:flagellar biosynthesis/type III secretory pathway chaperone [Thioflavicoccus mobilis 8321]|uniref:Flagellar biosynthesis/type III secretory pathway chaperone n=1 Tax=Thioflavicoccus mobilis 8321 TaxID=765912 RepID=L0GV30_9GAMM|nr:flagellar protein FlgN [Thioflavicoccus mobilis]AGA89159.1 flagellar biosynthesis/type III secretory pathway chaperone [Thioflavicoccus mobilis 8321]
MNDSARLPLAELSGLLNCKIELLEGLEKVLAAEATAVCSANYDEVLKFAEEKRGLAIKISDLAERLNQFLSAAGYSPDVDGIAQCVDASADDELTALYDAARRAALNCAAHNNVNGSLVERRRAAVGRALRVLLDRPEARGARYHRSGALEGVSDQRLIAEV